MTITLSVLRRHVTVKSKCRFTNAPCVSLQWLCFCQVPEARITFLAHLKDINSIDSRCQPLSHCSTSSNTLTHIYPGCLHLFSPLPTPVYSVCQHCVFASTPHRLQSGSVSVHHSTTKSPAAKHRVIRGGQPAGQAYVTVD